MEIVFGPGSLVVSEKSCFMLLEICCNAFINLASFNKANLKRGLGKKAQSIKYGYALH